MLWPLPSGSRMPACTESPRGPCRKKHTEAGINSSAAESGARQLPVPRSDDGVGGASPSYGTLLARHPAAPMSTIELERRSRTTALGPHSYGGCAHGAQHGGECRV